MAYPNPQIWCSTLKLEEELLVFLLRVLVARSYNVNLQAMWSEKSHVVWISSHSFALKRIRFWRSSFHKQSTNSKVLTKSTCKRCDQRNLMWVWISSHSFALKRIRFWMSSFHKQSTSSKVLTKSTCKRCDQRNLMWVWISSHSFALKRIRFWRSSFHKQSTNSKVLTKSTCKRCDQRNLMWVWISSHSFALKRIRFWMSSFHKQSTSSKVLTMSTCKRCDQRNGWGIKKKILLGSKKIFREDQKKNIMGIKTNIPNVEKYQWFWGCCY